MKPLGVKNYGSIPHLLGSKKDQTDKYVHEGQHRICTEKTRDKHDIIIVTEKYDGSNVGVCKLGGNIYALTRSGYLANTSPYQQHHVFDSFVQNSKSMFLDMLSEGERVVGEWLYQVHSLRYELGDEPPFVPFDMFTPAPRNERLLFDEFRDRVYPYINPARILHYGKALSIQDAMCKVKIRLSNIRCIDEPEGVVYRVERKGKVDFLAKYVRSDFEPGLHIIGKEEGEFLYN